MSRGGVRKIVQALGPETQEGTRDEAEKTNREQILQGPE